ncbi:diguanylate cyclase [Rhodobacteraceae bacterium D3-12]|nr:diguanylate cyclase [Rhodobacteraceae bacterium D3-12]
MPGKILIVDPVSTNRIVLKVKLSVANFCVAQAASGAEALTMVRKECPDLILCTDQLADMTAETFALRLRAEPAGASVPLVVVPPENARPDRHALLLAGADDILPRPLNDALLLARLRSLLRLRETSDELTLRKGVSRALGMSEAPEGFVTAPRIAVVATTMEESLKWARRLETQVKTRVLSCSSNDALRQLLKNKTPDAIVMVLDPQNVEFGLNLLADLRANPETRDCSITALTHDHTCDGIAADHLDRGANDTLRSDLNIREMSLRIERQIARKRRLERLRADMKDGLRAALIDPLTGLNNRRFAIPHLASIANASAQGGGEFATMVIDVDHFKLINDRFGHASGDAVLIRLGEVLKQAVQEPGFLARIGGEEFLVVLPNTGRGAAELAARRLCKMIETTPFPMPGHSHPLQVTVSIGVAMSSDIRNTSGTRPLHEIVLENADRALYGSKAHGRNRVTLCDDRSAA